ncbi:MAG TPA: histidine kinase [Verrucomicrobiae bacterium]|nr:histidine kinase [Verrucomicrobiae bacterium]
MRISVSLLVIWVACAVARADSLGVLPVTSAEQFLRLSTGEARHALHLNLDGVVRLWDAQRSLLVLQDDTGSLAIHITGDVPRVSSGTRVRVRADSAAVYAPAQPAFPLQPSGRGQLPSFEEQNDFNSHFLTRVRGLLIAPETGDYTFWIASRGCSELWLSSDASAANSRCIASVSPGNATRPRQWNKYPSQCSGPITLRGGERYYVETLREEGTGTDNLAVAWQGPNIELSVIPASAFVPATANALNGVQSLSGLVWEYWTNFFAGDVASISQRHPSLGEVAAVNPAIEILDPRINPQALRFTLSEGSLPNANFQFVEAEGTVRFIGTAGGQLVVELENDDAALEIHVLDWASGEIPRWDGMRMRAKGVLECSQTSAGLHPYRLSVASTNDVSVLDQRAGSFGPLIAVADLQVPAPGLGWSKRVSVRGVVEARLGEAVAVQGFDAFVAEISGDGSNWIQVGNVVEIPMEKTVQAGLMVTSFEAGQIHSARFDHISGLSGGSIGIDISNPQTSGGMQTTNNVRTVHGSGIGIGSVWDQFFFVTEAMEGDEVLTARIAETAHPNARASAGLMMRKSLENNAPFAAISLTAANTAVFQFRRDRSGRSEMASVQNVSPPCWLRLQRKHASVVVLPKREGSWEPGDMVEVSGFLEWRDGTPMLRDASLIGISRTGSQRKFGAPPQPNQRAALRIADIVLGKERADRDSLFGFIEGTVTYCDTSPGSLLVTVQDETAGMFVRMTPRLSRQGLAPGDRVRMSGRRVNDKWPVPFEPETIALLGHGRLPRPVTYGAARSLPNDGEGHWLEVEGVVRAVDRLQLVLAIKDGLVRVRTPEAGRFSSLVDARVRVRGVAVREGEELALLMPSPRFLNTVETPPVDPFLLPRISLAEARSFGANSDARWIKVLGTVTFARSNLLFLEQAGNAGRVVPLQADAALKPGDQVEVVGFPQASHDVPVTVNGAAVRRVGRAAPPLPLSADLAREIPATLNGRLINSRATLLEQRVQSGFAWCDLQAGDRIFKAVCPVDRPLARMEPGSVVEAIGVLWRPEISNPADAPILSSWQLLLRSPADLKVIRNPPWWTWKHTAAIAAGFVVVLGAAMVWIRELQRRVVERTKDLQVAMRKLEKETQASATLAERDRLAGEIHDGLEQGLSGIMMQLDGVESALQRNPANVRHYLELARNMVRFSRAEVRHSLWNLQSPVLENSDLPTALREIARQMVPSNGAKVIVEILGEPMPLPTSVEHHLLRVCQEALNNALKHADAAIVRVTLEYGLGSVSVSVMDDGKGFLPDAALVASGGHLGLRNLKSRARKIGGELHVISRPREGTVVRVTVPGL